MNNKIGIIFYFLSYFTFVNAQRIDLIQDNYFQHVVTKEFKEIGVADYQGQWVCTEDQVSTVGLSTRQSDGVNVLQMNFRVNSVKVDDHFVSTRLSTPMKAGYQYQLSFEVAKDKFSGYSLKEFTALFTTSKLNIPNLNYNDWRNSSVTFSLDSIYNGKSMIRLEAVYTAMGGEGYLHLGSINQTFKFLETTKYNLMLADETYKAAVAGAVYFVTNVHIEPVGNKENVLKSVNEFNAQDVKNEYGNLVFNGGFESKLADRISTTTFNNSGELAGPFVRSVNEMGVKVIQSDSNDYKSIYQKEVLPYMGNSLASFKALATNESHIYQKSVKVVKGQDYNTTYYYENHPPRDTMPVFKYGANICFALKESLIKDSTYSFSFMVQLDKRSSYGLDYLGFHALDSFPENTTNKIWDKTPDQVIPIKDLADVAGWNEKQILYKAKGGEEYIALGAVFPRYDKVKNQNFVPEVYSTCGPNDGYCYGREVHFSDSLFANYFIDNVVCLPIANYQANPSAIYGDDINQIEIVFTPMLRGSDSKDSLFYLAQNSLVACLDVLRTTDAICIVDITKRDDVTLAPYEVINKKKIIRKVYKPKLQRKIKDVVEDDNMLLFSGEETKGFNNHIVILVDETFDFSKWEYKLTKFDKNGGYLTFVSLASPSEKIDLAKKLSIYHNALILDVATGDVDVKEQLLKRLMILN